MMLCARKQNINVFVSRSLLRFIDCRKKYNVSIAGNSRFCSSDSGEKICLASSTEHHDIAIVGGGMVGLAFACALASLPVTKRLRVAIVDSNPTLQSQASIMKTEIPDPRMADSQKSIYTARLASMTTEQPIGNDSPSGAASSGGAAQQVHYGRLMKMDLDNGKSIYSKLVVGADGSKSRVSEISRTKTTAWNYSQNAVICTVEHNETKHCAWQRFLPSGPTALLPMGDRFSNIVWTMKPEEALNHKSMSKEDFVKAVNYALDYGFGAHPKPNFLDQVLDRFTTTASTTECFQVPPKITSVVTERMAFPLSLMHAHEYALKRVALIGDAAHAVHPLAGQGVNLGFGDASALAKIIAEGLSVGAEIGELSVLKRYENERKTANMAMMAILDGFQKACSIDLGPINILRAAALHGAQFIAPLKRNIIQYAMGEQKWPIFS